MRCAVLGYVVLVLNCRHGQRARIPRCGREIASCRFDDVRDGKRLGVLLEQLSERIGGSIPFACQDWAATKAAYRFFSNARISEDKILAGHFLCIRERFASARGGPVLVLHDTSEFVYRSEENEAIGMVTHADAGSITTGSFTP